jgi:hypothetical protein
MPFSTEVKRRVRVSPCRAAIDVVVGQVDEVLLAEASLGLGA